MIASQSSQHEEVAERFRAFARASGVLMIVVALMVLCGWWLDLPLLTTLVPGQQSMKVGTSFGFILAGLALLARLSDDARLCRACIALSLALLLLGLLNLAQHLGLLSLGMDRWFPDPYALRHGQPPGRMSQLTAAGFVTLGAVGMMSSAQRGRWFREVLAVATLGIAMYGLASYGLTLAGQEETLFRPLALPTAVLLLLATLAWMSATPDQGLTRIATADSLGGAVARRLLLPSLLLPVLITFSLETLQHFLGMTQSAALSLSALLSGGLMASMIWWAANLLERLEQQRRQTRALRDDANTDGLTGLANRRAFDAAIERLAGGRRDQDAAFSLLMLDLDKFKNYNDDFGHQAGDEVLRRVGRLLRAVLRPTDLPARYGGEEFAVLLPDTDLARACDVAERVLNAFRNDLWPHRPVTVSIGVAEAEADDAAELVRRADEALYAAKRGGRDRYRVAGMAALAGSEG